MQGGTGWLGALILICISVCYIFTSIKKLYDLKKYQAFANTLFAFIISSFIIFFGLSLTNSIEDKDSKIWAAIPFFAAIPFYMMSGFLYRKYTDAQINPSKDVSCSEENSGQWLGVGLIILGISIWCYGIVHPKQSNLLIIVELYALGSGLFRFIPNYMLKR